MVNFEIKFNSYIDAIGDGALRSRSIISYLMIATFISALSLFNALKPDKNWLTSRLKSLQNASLWAKFENEQQRTTALNKVKMPNADTLVINSFSTYDIYKDSANTKKLLPSIRNTTWFYKDTTWYNVFFPKDTFSTSIVKLPTFCKLSFPSYCIKEDSSIDFDIIDSLQFASAIKHLSGSRVAVSRSELEWQINNINRAIIENSILINVPILGISFDVNGLAIISACAFSILYFLLFYNLARERKNFTLIFKLAENLNIDKVSLYQLLSMRQVLTIPGSIDEFIESKKQSEIIPENLSDGIKIFILKVLTVSPISLPIFVWIVIFAYDRETANVGKSISNTLTKSNENASLFCGFMMVTLFLFCIYEWNSIGRVWDLQKGLIKEDLLAGIPKNTEGIAIDENKTSEDTKDEESKE